jgi:thioredoxin-like negative regulator of GroEL
MAKNYPNLKFGNIDIDQLQALITELDVSDVPVIHAYKDGELVAEIVGDNKEKLEAFCKNN